MNCPNCKVENVRRLIAPPDKTDGVLYCPACYHSTNRTNCNLGQVVDKWVDEDGKTRRVTYGKAWEIENRRISKDDGVTVVNYATGQETKY
jgi:transcription elongation factor Elf1